MKQGQQLSYHFSQITSLNNFSFTNHPSSNQPPAYISSRVHKYDQANFLKLHLKIFPRKLKTQILQNTIFESIFQVHSYVSSVAQKKKTCILQLNESAIVLIAFHQHG